MKGVVPLVDEADPPATVKSDGRLNVINTPGTVVPPAVSALTVIVSVSSGSPLIVVGVIVRTIGGR